MDSEKLKMWELQNQKALKTGIIIHTIIMDGLTEAFEKYPEETDFILDYMNNNKNNEHNTSACNRGLLAEEK